MDTGRISSETTYVYVGTFTGPNQAQGLSVFRMDPATGGLTHAHTVTGDGADNPSFLALHPFYTQRPYLYAVNSINTFEGLRSGSVSAFSIEPATGQLTFLNRVASHGRRPIHL
ncbi:MAG: lactonase family protein, partial [Chloroflexota bacterium]